MTRTNRTSLLTTSQAAKIAGVAPRTVSKWVDAGLLKGFRLPGYNNRFGGDRRIHREHLLEFLTSNNMPLHAPVPDAPAFHLGNTSSSKEAVPVGCVQRLCECSSRTASSWFDTGRIAGYRLPNRGERRFLVGSLQKFLIENRVWIPRKFLEEFPLSALVVSHDPALAEDLQASLGPLWKVRSARDSLADADALVGHKAAAVIDCRIGTRRGRELATGQFSGNWGRVVVLANEDDTRDFDKAAILPHPVPTADIVEEMCRGVTDLIV